MKRLAWLIIIISLPIISYFQYKKYTKFHPPSLYQYKSNDSIDINYYDPSVVQHYFENIYKMEGITRELWYSKGLDVKFPDLGIDGSKAEVDYFHRLYAVTKILEKKLVYSTLLKAKGFNTLEVKEIVELGIHPDIFRLTKKHNLLGLQMGDGGIEVWELQRLLLAKSYEIPYDGVFGVETKQCILDFQEKNKLMPTGIVNESTIKHLIE